MTLTMRGAALLAALAAAQPLPAQDARTTIAVLPFENGGSYGQDKENFDALEVGLPVMVAAALAAHPGARVVPAGAVRNAMAHGDVSGARRIDAASATAVAKAAGARYAVTGSFADFYGKFRINARLVDAESGEIVKVVSNDDPKLQDRTQLSAILQHVGDRLAAALGLASLPADPARGGVPTEALTDFSRGVLFESRGERAKAAESYQRALTTDPNYSEARDALARTREK
jgi:TolB-like protein